MSASPVIELGGVQFGRPRALLIFADGTVQSCPDDYVHAPTLIVPRRPTQDDPRRERVLRRTFDAQNWQGGFAVFIERGDVTATDSGEDKACT